MSARVNGQDLPPQTFLEPGEHTYSQAAPAGAIDGDTAEVEFTLDRAVGPGQADRRELGVVVSFRTPSGDAPASGLPLEFR